MTKHETFIFFENNLYFVYKLSDIGCFYADYDFYLCRCVNFIAL